MTDQENKEQLNETPMVQVGEVRFHFDGKSYNFSPTDDVSAKEVCLILQMVLNVLANKSASVDIASFIAKHNLGRHFPESEEETK